VVFLSIIPSDFEVRRSSSVALDGFDDFVIAKVVVGSVLVELLTAMSIVESPKAL
jgi:hypothetical protein